jgi:glycosyltransferase involved in cell wall biosynthesis
MTARRDTRFHAVSSAVADVMATRLRVARRRIDVISRGRDPAVLGERTDERRRAARAALGASDADRVLLAVGRQEYQKGFDVLLRALASMRHRGGSTRLFIAGRDGAATPALLAAVDSLGVRDAVEFLGTRDDVPELLCAADVFVFPSRWEGMPGGVIEAMALEAPIVATDIAPVREVVDGTGALLVPVDDEAALERAITRALRNDTATATAAGRARFLERFTIDGVSEEMLRFYRRATKT